MDMFENFEICCAIMQLNFNRLFKYVQALFNDIHYLVLCIYTVVQQFEWYELRALIIAWSFYCNSTRIIVTRDFWKIKINLLEYVILFKFILLVIFEYVYRDHRMEIFYTFSYYLVKIIEMWDCMNMLGLLRTRGIHATARHYSINSMAGKLMIIESYNYVYDIFYIYQGIRSYLKLIRQKYALLLIYYNYIIYSDNTVALLDNQRSVHYCNQCNQISLNYGWRDTHTSKCRNCNY